MSSDFQFAYGSAAGRDHRRAVPPLNNQDALHVLHGRNGIVAVVADGCGSGENSEVGAHLGVRLLATLLMRHLDRGRPITGHALDRARKAVAGQILTLANSLGESLSEVVTRYFLFTLVGVVITEETTVFFNLGDGVVIINGEVIVLEPEEGNQSNYLAYELTGSEQTNADPSKLRFQIMRRLPTADLKDFLIGTDGVNELIAREASRLPGTEEVVGPISQFWTDSDYFDNEIALSFRLNLMARDVQKASNGRVIKRGGILGDDTTLVVGRRLPAPEEE